MKKKLTPREQIVQALEEKGIAYKQLEYIPGFGMLPWRGWYIESPDGDEYHLGKTTEMALENIKKGNIKPEP